MDINRVKFPGAVNSQFTSTMAFEHPSTYPAIPTYRCTSPEGDLIDPSVSLPPNSLALAMYENMLGVSIMDVIMFEAQRQGRLSFYMTGQGEEGTCVGSASALEKEDVIFSQYREAGVFKQRGFTFEEFMSQLFANRKDYGKGRNMPVHYGSRELNIVSSLYLFLPSLFSYAGCQISG
jgi:2-oxoisovalerate dehydrogenase E1 component alpha subunit